MSQEGLDKLKKELAEALAQRPVISAAIAEAREKGDLSENAEYESAREAQGLLLDLCKCLQQRHDHADHRRHDDGDQRKPEHQQQAGLRVVE